MLEATDILARRHLEPWEWGWGFERLLESRGVKRGRGGDRRSTAKVAVDTVGGVAKEAGVPLSTAEKRLRAADQFKALSPEQQRAR